MEPSLSLSDHNLESGRVSLGGDLGEKANQLFDLTDRSLRVERFGEQDDDLRK